MRLRQGEAVPRKMGRHPVDDHADAPLMQVVDQPGKILRRAVPVGGRKEAGDLVAPGAVERMFRHREELHVGVTHLGGVVGQHRRQFAVGQRPFRILDHPPPRTEVQLVDGEGPVQLTRAGGPLLEPHVVAPGVAQSQRWRRCAAATK